MKNSLAKFVCLIKLSLARRKLNAKVPYSKLNFKILKLLYNEGYIRGFRVVENSFIYIFFKLNFFRLSVLDIAYFSPNNRNNFLSYKKLISLFGLKNFGIVSTNMGLLTLEQCFFYKKGGILLLLIK